MRTSLTIKLDETPLDALHERSAAGFPSQNALLLSLSKVVSQESVERRGDDREDNGEGSEAPSPLVTVEEESLSRLGAGEGGDHVRRRGESVCETSVLELCRIGRDNIDAVSQTGPTNLPEDLRGISN